MTETKSPNQPKDQTKVEDRPDPDLMSLEDLDKVIAQADPNALKNIEGVREIASEMKEALELVELDDYLIDPALKRKKKIQEFISKAKLKFILLWVWFKSQCIEKAKKLGIWATNQKAQVQEGLAQFKHWPLKSKLLFVMAISLVFVVVAFAYLAFVKKTLYYKQELFITSLSELAEHSWDTSKEEARETFYNSARIPKNIFKLRKIVVNIEPSESSGSNPMVALELSLEGNSSEVLVEIKDREGEILDSIQRTIEGYTFDELNDTEGKRMITEKVRSAVNRLLTLGKIRRVYLQGIIFKP